MKDACSGRVIRWTRSTSPSYTHKNARRLRDFFTGRHNVACATLSQADTARTATGAAGGGLRASPPPAPTVTPTSTAAASGLPARPVIGPDEDTSMNRLLRLLLLPFAIALALAAPAEAQFETPNRQFHNQTGFPLEGRHRDVACTSCHINSVYKGTPTTLLRLSLGAASRTTASACSWDRSARRAIVRRRGPARASITRPTPACRSTARTASWRASRVTRTTTSRPPTRPASAVTRRTTSPRRRPTTWRRASRPTCEACHRAE